VRAHRAAFYWSTAPARAHLFVVGARDTRDDAVQNFFHNTA
jgi:hypothetical protein